MKTNPSLAVFALSIGMLFGLLLAYNHEQNALNRKAYYECLRITEEIARLDDRNGIRIVSTPSCRLP